MKDELVLVSKKEFRKLIRDSILYEILEGDGVDNWSFYMAGLDDYIESLSRISGQDIRSVEDAVDAFLRASIKSGE